MNIVTEIREWQEIRKQLSGKTIGFVPTMGNLHSGHLSLCQNSKMENEITLVSIFVNPVQFNQASDFENYPRTLSRDKEFLTDHKIDYLLLPDAHTIYSDNYQIQVTETNLSLELEGEFRPGYFNGMLTVVMKLLNLIQPTRAYFGEKDYQQLLLVKKMVNSLFLPTEIVACETVRAEDGLALSSRNSRLTPEQRIKSAIFPKLLQSSLGVEKITEQLKSLGFKVDYIAEKWGRRLGAVWLDAVRLIDNVSIK
jgi:pantoate--beta-alanine ligase